MKDKADITLILPKRASNRIELDLIDLTKILVTNGLAENFGGILGGEFGYGTDFENSTFFMAHDCQGFCRDKNGKPTCKACKRGCNFEHKASGYKIRWYKWIGRSMEYVPKKPSSSEWKVIFKDCLISIELMKNKQNIETMENGRIQNKQG